MQWVQNMQQVCKKIDENRVKSDEDQAKEDEWKKSRWFDQNMPKSSK